MTSGSPLHSGITNPSELVSFQIYSCGCFGQDHCRQDSSLESYWSYICSVSVVGAPCFYKCQYWKTRAGLAYCSKNTFIMFILQIKRSILICRDYACSIDSTWQWSDRPMGTDPGKNLIDKSQTDKTKPAY